MEVSGELHAPAALPPGKEPPFTMGEEAGYIPEPVRRRWRREEIYHRIVLSLWNVTFLMNIRSL